MKRIFRILAMLMILIPAQTYAVKFIGTFYDPGSIDDNCTTLHMRFTIEGYQPTDVISVLVYDQGKLKEQFIRFNTELDLEGKPKEGDNFFTVRNMKPGGSYTFVYNINENKIEEPLKMLGKPTPPIVPPKELPREVLPFKIYPNPSQGNFFIEIPFDKASINITDASGKLIYSNLMISERVLMNDYIANGIYFIILIKGDKVIDIKKLFINH